MRWLRDHCWLRTLLATAIGVCLERGYDERHLRLLSICLGGIAAASVIAAGKLLWDSAGGYVTIAAAAAGTLVALTQASDLADLLATCLGL